MNDRQPPRGAEQDSAYESLRSISERSATRAVRLPRPVGPGARLGVAALSGPVDPRRLERGLDALRSLGFEPVPAANLLARQGLFAGSDAARLEGFESLLRDPKVDGIVFARGGHGLLRLLPSIDFDLIARRKLPLVGYSDLTPLLNLVVDRCRLVTFHGPMVAAELADEPLSSELDALVEMLEGHVERKYEVSWIQGSEAHGPLRGGCLSMLVATAGTPFFPELAESILVLEDVGEAMYRWDRMLTHLHLSGSLSSARALVLGHVDEAPGLDSVSWTEWLRDLSAELDLPVSERLLAGHGRPNLTLPLGAPSHLDPSRSLLMTTSPQTMPS